ncbi:MAG: tape measure protein [Mesorhizobium sp.]
MADDQILAVDLVARDTDFRKSFERARRSAVSDFDAIESRSQTFTNRLENNMAGASARINTGFKNFGLGLLSGIAASLSVDRIKRLLDTSTAITNALKVAGLSGENLTKVYDKLYVSAQKNGAPLDALVTLYGRAAQQQKELGVSSGQLLTFTDNVAVALRVAGTDASQASGALLQLGQALGSGTVHAEEFNSILEGVPTIAQAVAAGIKEAGGSVAALKQLVVDGKVSSKAFFDGFAVGAETLQAKVAGATMTTSQGFTILSNALVRAAGRFDATTETSKRFGATLNDLAAYVDQLNFDALMGNLDALAEKLNSLNSLAQNFGETIGQALGTDNLGKWLATTSAGQAIGMTSPAGIRDRMAGDLPQADAVVQQWAQKHYGSGAATTSTPKTDRIPADQKVQQISLADYPTTGGGKGKGGGTKAKGPDDFEREITQTQARIAALRAETTAQAGVNPLIDDYGRAVERARVRQELLTAAQKAGVAITPDVSAKIDRLAQSYADASVASRQLADEQDKTRQSAEEFAGLGKDVLGGFISDLRSGKSAAEALSGALDKVADKLLDMALNSLFSTTGGGGIMGIVGSLFGFSEGGAVHLAGGGHVRGPGTSTSDSIPARLSDGEFVVNARATARNRALLEAVNDNRLPGFADGGLVGGAPVFSGNDNSAGQHVAINTQVTVNTNGGGTPADNADLSKKIGRQVEASLRGLVSSELQRAMRPGNLANNRSGRSR